MAITTAMACLDLIRMRIMIFDLVELLNFEKMDDVLGLLLALAQIGFGLWILIEMFSYWLG